VVQRQPRRVLVVHEDILIGFFIEGFLSSISIDVVGMKFRMGDAIAALNRSGFDFAVIDIDLIGERAEELLDMLANRGTGFALVSEYGAEGIPERYRHHAYLEWSSSVHNLRQVLGPAIHVARQSKPCSLRQSGLTAGCERPPA
jgi:DNA-binding NtrC family response regulator